MKKASTAWNLQKWLSSPARQRYTLHGRTRSQQYSGTADWDVIREVKQAVCIPVSFANGDVAEPEDAVRILAHTGADGVMIGRGSLR